VSAVAEAAVRRWKDLAYRARHSAARARLWTERDYIEFLWERIEPEPMSGCWIWIGMKSRYGYGRVLLQGRRWASAHRLMYECVRGSIPDGLSLDHKCRNTACVNPAHLEPVTQRENCRRGVKGVLAPPYCPKGHARFVRRASGRRRCRDCKNALARAARRRRAANIA